MSKKSKIFLWISFTIFTISVIGVLVGIITSCHQAEIKFPDDGNKYLEEVAVVLIWSAVFIFPIFPLELSCIRSVYKTLKCQPTGFVKMCYIISAVLSFVVVVFQWLVFTGIISFYEIENGQNIMHTILLWTEWPVFILSFVLGSIRNKIKN